LIKGYSRLGRGLTLIHVAMIHTVTTNELSRVFVTTVPGLLGRAKGSRVGVLILVEIKNGVDRSLGIANAEHDCVLIRADDGGELI